MPKRIHATNRTGDAAKAVEPIPLGDRDAETS